MASDSYSKPKRSSSSSSSPMNYKLCTSLFFITLFTIPTLFLLRTHNYPSVSIICTTTNKHSIDTSTNAIITTTRADPRIANIINWSGDLRQATFSWNKLTLPESPPPKTVLKIAVFSRKWPIGSVPGGMERHAYTLHTSLAKRGHKVHIFTSPYSSSTTQPLPPPNQSNTKYPLIHCHEGEPGRWRYNKAWDQFVEENKLSPFDVVHTESVALPHWLSRHLPNLVVSWHGIALESLQSSIYQDLARPLSEPMSPGFNSSIQGVIPKVLNEIRFFHNYAHHVAISDSCGEMLRDVYQIPNKRVHVIVNGVDEGEFKVDEKSGIQFREKIGLPKNNVSIVLGTAGRLVKDKGHPLLFTAFSKLIKNHPNVYLIVAGSGPWESRYRELKSKQIIVLGSMNPEELRGFYNAIDVFVNPTLRPQGLDLTLMEAMMSGKPVMASRFPSIKGTIVVNDEFGFMFAPNAEELLESLETVVKEGKERLKERGKACREYAVGLFTAKKMALAYERLFLCVKNETFCAYR